MSIRNKIENSGCILIPISEIEIIKDKTKTTAYDLTVEDYFTFCTSDGIFVQDTMAVFHPLTNESQNDIKTKMTNVVSGTSSDEFSTSLSKEMFVGLYMISKDSPNKNLNEITVTDEDLDKIRDPYIYVRYRNQKTTAGRAIINSFFPANYPFINKLVTKKVIKIEIERLYNSYGQDAVKYTMNKLKNCGFKWATIMSPNMTLNDLELPPEIYALKKQLIGATPDKAQEIMTLATKLIVKHLEDTGLGDLANSGASRGVGQIIQILFAKGIITDTSGNILPIVASSFADGFDNMDYFSMSSMGRKGIIDRVLGTASTGYMSRKLAYVTNSVEISRNIQDCKTTKLLQLKLTDLIIPRLSGRYISVNGKIELFDAVKYKSGDVIYLRSPIFCKTPKICHTCYGNLIKRHKTLFIGILAAQVIGERGTQLAMRSFHNTSITMTKRNILKDITNNQSI
jgi:DNA-directed RNA polymerase subunit beta'